MNEESQENQVENVEEQAPAEAEAEVTEAVDKKPAPKVGPAVVFIIAALCLIVIIWFVHALWTMPKSEEQPEQPVNPLVIPDRNRDTLGVRIDAELGRFFTEPATGHTLYVKAGEDCSGACLDDWIPYLANEAVEDGGAFGTVVREDTGELQYTWNGQSLYTYVLDTTNTTLGTTEEGWQLARP
jgi:hypothetical protein